MNQENSCDITVFKFPLGSGISLAPRPMHPWVQDRLSDDAGEPGSKAKYQIYNIKYTDSVKAISILP